MEERPLKVHLYRDQHGAVYGKGRKPRPYADTACKHNWPVKLTTTDPDEVTCLRCRASMRFLAIDLSQVPDREVALSAAEDLLDQYRARTARLERALRFALEQMGDLRYALVHPATDFGVGDLIEAILADQVKEPDQ